jgi:hypothetical protein
VTNKPVEPPRFQIRAFVNGLGPGIDPDKMNQLLDQLAAEGVGQDARAPAARLPPRNVEGQPVP